MPGIKLALLLLIAVTAASAQKFYTYVGDLGPNFVLIAWGTASGRNTIGRSSPSHGKATVRLGEQTIESSDRNWVVVRNLTPDTEYRYEVSVNGRSIGKGEVHTWPEKSDRVCFFVIGDWGNGSSGQYQIADAMWREFQKRQDSGNPVRFVITTGDNIYGELGFAFFFRSTGRYDSEWGPKFFQPYEPLIRQIPFYPSLGNHDGNETENRADLTAYLDNFFFSGFSPARYYRFSFGGLVDFFALDSTLNTESGNERPAYDVESRQFTWLQDNLQQSKVPWKIPYFHHPPFNAGPGHAASARELSHFLTAFQKNGVKIVFTGHEHNFQISEENAATYNIRFVVTGAGGELRRGDVRSAMERSNIAAWAPDLHYLIVEIEGKEMRITPASFRPFTVFDRRRERVPVPFRVNLP